MKCPNCNEEMQDKGYSYYGLGEWDCDYPRDNSWDDYDMYDYYGEEEF